MKNYRLVGVRVLLVLFVLFSNQSLAQDCRNEIDRVVAPDGIPGAQLGFAVDISGDFAVIGAIGDNDNGIGSGSAYVFQYNGLDWAYRAKLTASDGEPGDTYGWSVAISGDTIAISATGVDNLTGAIYIYKFNGSHWIERAKLYASDHMPFDYFGYSVDLWGDNLIVGAIGTDDLGADSGSVYMFQYNGAVWTQQAKLFASDGEAGDIFGQSVAISGIYAVVGLPADSNNGINSGSVFIFKYIGTNWVQQWKLIAADGVEAQHYGRSVAISGTTLVVGAPYGAFNVSNLGSVYIYALNRFVWTLEDKVFAPDGFGFSNFGESVSISPDSSTIVVGAHGTNPSSTGAGHIYKKSNSVWQEQSLVLASDGQAGHHFGFKVAVSDSTALISAPSYAGSSGAGYFFDHNQTPCLADLSGDCVLNFFDVSAFLSAFSAGDPAADFTGDGSFNFFDVSAFLSAFSAGCP